jgi:hypothetical protein
VKEIFSTVTYEIQPGETVPMWVGRARLVRASGAKVWITRGDDPHDYWLVPGDEIGLRAGERLWIGVDGDRAAQLVFTMSAACGERVSNWLGARLEAFRERRRGWRLV